ncbi:ATP-dependent Clp protease proteolytic subunit [uncultured Empedobacter sp.]|uniref:ATP-dependent Clp protease proteolytic subunit n=1 Tax=uncultured Empedobacter sp. TaxID=410844 RepID=UPI0025CE70B5|nr:ATP-dependent Clp protease proteolytic subunit [uncultured Empedobacter sp.]
MYQILLYGDIVSYDSQSDNITSKKVFNELLLANGQDLEITINTLGGDVSEAFAIVQMLDDYKTKHNATIKTIALGECASSGVLLLLAGDIREVKSNCKPFIHNVWTTAQGDANDFINLGFDLEEANWKIALFYNERAGIDYDYARELMGLNTSLTAEECELLGFATPTKELIEDEPQLVLLNKLQRQKSNQSNMEKNEKGLFNLLKNFFTGQSTTIQNEKEVHTADGDTLVFPELDSEDSIEVGDEATIDGQQANGEVTTLEGDVIDFEAGVVTSIEEAEAQEEPVEDESEVNLLKAELESLKAELVNIKNQNTELIQFKNKVTSIESQEVVTEKKSLENKAEKIDYSADYLRRKQARK